MTERRPIVLINGGGAELPVGDTIPSDAITGKQDTLVSGTNIKTINGNTLLGSGNLVISGGGGGGSSGTVVVDFGTGSNFTTAAVTGLTGIGAGAGVKAWVMGDSTADHSDYHHARVMPSILTFAAGAVIAGVGFTLYVQSEILLRGLVSVRYEWS